MNKEKLRQLNEDNRFIKPALFIGRCAEILANNLKNTRIYKYEDIGNTQINEFPIFDITGISSEQLSYIIETFKDVTLINYKENIIDSQNLSKINLIIKDSNVAYSELLKASEANDLLKTSKLRDFDKFYSETSPELYYLRSKTKGMSSSSKYIELISKDDINVS